MRGLRIRRSLSASLFIAALALTLAAPATAQPLSGTIFGKNLKIQYRDFDWRIYHATHFDVYYYDEEQLERVVSFAESAYDHLSQVFDYQIKTPTPLIFYRTHAEFQQTNVIQNFIPEGTGAFATSVRNRMVLPVDMPDKELMELILHELVHIFQYHVLYGGSTGKGIVTSAPTWVNEGMASYLAEDETARDQMYLRDAVVNDRIPSVGINFGGFFAYRFGHAVFDFMEDRWGREGFRDFIFELRNTIGSRVGRAIERAFNMSVPDFDFEFRRWLRQKYLPELVATGEPGDFGRPFRNEKHPFTYDSSPVASPSGDLLAAMSTPRGEVDVVLFDTRSRSFVKNLTKGFTTDYQYFIAQEIGNQGRDLGNDLAFSPSGNTVAAFARREGGRDLILIDVLKGKQSRRIRVDVDQALSPTYSPDGRYIAFSGHRGGQFDIFQLDLETEEVTNLTNDDLYDGSPVYSPDGESIVMSSFIGDYAKLFRVPLNDSSQRYQISFGESTETDAVFSADGNRVYFTSDRSGANNIFGVDLNTGDVVQFTNSVTGCFMPTVLNTADGKERLVYTAFWNGRFDLYRLDIDRPLTPPQLVAQIDVENQEQPLNTDDLPRFEPAIEVAVDDANKDNYGGFNFFLEDLGMNLGVSDDQTWIGAAVATFSDYLGDRRIIGYFQSVESFQNFDILYINQRKRLNWRAHLFDNRDFYVGFNGVDFQRVQNAVTRTGARGSLVYPISFYLRAEASLGYLYRELDLQEVARDPETGFPIEDENGNFIPVVEPREDDYPELGLSLVGDSTIFASWGPVSGRRWRISGVYAPDRDPDEELGEGNTLHQSLRLDVRQYFSLSRRIQVALRGFGYTAKGNAPTPIYFGGLDDVRGFEFRRLNGDNGFYTNFELRFPLIDRLEFPGFRFQGIRGFLFLDVAGAWYDDFQDFDFWDNEENRLEDAVSTYGWGFSVRMLGMDWNWAFSKQWDFDTSESGMQTTFWIGQRF